MTDSSYYDPRDAFVRFGNKVVRTASIVAVNLAVTSFTDKSPYVELRLDGDQNVLLYGNDAVEARKWFTSSRVSTP